MCSFTIECIHLHTKECVLLLRHRMYIIHTCCIFQICICMWLMHICTFQIFRSAYVQFKYSDLHFKYSDLHMHVTYAHMYICVFEICIHVCIMYVRPRTRISSIRWCRHAYLRSAYTCDICTYVHLHIWYMHTCMYNAYMYA